MADIRVLKTTARSMQRLGYLKRLIRRVASLSTSNLENLGNDLTETVTRRVRIPLDGHRAAYIKQRLTDRAYTSLKAQADAWLNSRQEGEPPIVAMEVQDLYLADPALPSHVGKLVRNDWRKYPHLGVHLGLIRAGTFSPNTRAYSLLHFVTDAELQAFSDYKPEANPLSISPSQALLLLFSFLENDGEVVAPLLAQLAEEAASGFTDRDAGDRLPAIYRGVISRHRSGSISADDRERLSILEKTAESIVQSTNVGRYEGGSAREESSRPRVEPYVDIGLLSKPNPFKYEYAFTKAGTTWANALAAVKTSSEVDTFRTERFFSTASAALGFQAREASNPDEIVSFLHRAWESIHSAGGYAPIEELALVAGIEALLKSQLIIEPGVARQSIIEYQRAHPYEVRFTVNRMGVLAHAKFLGTPSEAQSADAASQEERQ